MKRMHSQKMNEIFARMLEEQMGLLDERLLISIQIHAEIEREFLIDRKCVRNCVKTSFQFMHTPN